MLVKFYMSDNSVWSRDIGTVPPQVGDYVLIMNSAETARLVQGQIIARRCYTKDGAPTPVVWECQVDSTTVPW